MFVNHDGKVPLGAILLLLINNGLQMKGKKVNVAVTIASYSSHYIKTIHHFCFFTAQYTSHLINDTS